MTDESTFTYDPHKAFCPRCSRSVFCIQAYAAPTIVMGVVFYAWSNDTLVGCPRCVRLALIGRLLLNIVTANIICWLVLPVYLVQLLRSLWDTMPHIPEKYRGQLSTKPVPFDSNPKAFSPTVRLIIVVVVLLVVLLVVLVVLPHLAAK